jgi:ferrous iron transport protein A
LVGYVYYYHNRNRKFYAGFTFIYTIEEMIRLSELSVGQKAVIHSFEKDEIFIKLMEMGCVPGEKVQVEQIAPLGDPISISVAGYHLSLRLNEANSIFVEMESISIN